MVFDKGTNRKLVGTFWFRDNREKWDREEQLQYSSDKLTERVIKPAFQDNKDIPRVLVFPNYDGKTKLKDDKKQMQSIK